MSLDPGNRAGTVGRWIRRNAASKTNQEQAEERREEKRERDTGVYQDIPADLKQMIEPVVEDHGFELVNVETIRGGGPALLRVTIDNKAGDGRVPVDDLAGVSRELESHLDASDVISSAYRLEVSSPGLDRMLAREKDFHAASGSEVKLKTRRPLDGRRRFKGELIEFEDGVVEMRIDGESVRIAFDDIEKANVVYSFSSTDFQGASSD